MTALNGLHDVDRERARVTADAGASIETLISRLLPLGLFPSVVPGTRHVTVGGAIASDVHGKDHHRDGGFGEHVEWLELLTPRGERIVASRRDAPDVFAATVGGLGLTGVILRASLRLRRVETSRIRVDTERARDLDEALARLESGDAGYRYSVAWIDCMARGARLGRSVLRRGDHAVLAEVPVRQRERALSRRTQTVLTAPPRLPNRLLSRSIVTAFNAAYFHRAPRLEQGRLEPLNSFFFPLDAIRGWNRLYGSRGFLQYQLAVPLGAEDALRVTIERLSHAGVGSFLAVLKRFGHQSGLLAFPIEGWTLALDIPASIPGLAPLLDSIDELVAGAGGRIYLSKDARLRPDLLAAMYPRLEEWKRIRARLDPDSAMRSDLARRLALTDGPERSGTGPARP